MKLKLTAVLLAVLLAFTLGACRKKGTKNKKVPDQTVVVTNENGETQTDAEGQPVTQTVPATEQTGAPVTDANGSTVTDAQGAPVTTPAPASPAADNTPPPEDAPIETIEDENGEILAPAEPETPVEKFNNALLEAFTDEQKSNQWFSAFGADAGNNGVNAILSMEQNSDDTNAAFRLAVSYHEAAKKAAQTAGLTLTSYEFTVLHDGMTVGMYTTTDGTTYSAVVNGETVSLTA